jgi:uncharacterized membrane protein
MFVLVSFYGGTSLYTYFYGHPVSYTQFYCKAYYYIIHLLSIMFRWNLAAACLDRYALSSTNVRLRRFANIYIARRVVTIIGLISIVFPVHDLVVYDLRAGSCIIVYGYTASLYNGIFTIINISVIPIYTMVICSFFIRRNLAIKRARRQVNVSHQQKTNDREHLQRKRDQQALVMLFSQILVYIVLTVPYTICTIYNAISLNVQNKSADRVAIERFLLSLTGLIITLFPTSSFYLYTLTSNMFRKELFIMLHSIVSCRYCVNNRRIEPRTIDVPLRIPTVQ